MSYVPLSSSLQTSTRWTKTSGGSLQAGRLVMRGGMFSISQGVRGNPINFDLAAEVLKNHVRLNGRNFDQALLDIGAQIKDYWIELLEGGEGTPDGRPLSENTHKARSDRGNPPEPFLFETGEVIRNTNVTIIHHGEGGTSAAIAIVPGSGKSPHGGALAQWNLLSALTQEGMVVRANQLTPDGLGRLMGWRDKHFGNPRPKKGGGGEDWMTLSEASRTPEGAGGHGYAQDRHGTWMETAASQANRLGGKTAIGEGGPIINIPPRPLFNATMEDKLSKMATTLLQQVFMTDAIMTAKAFSQATVGTVGFHKAAIHRGVS